MQLVPQQVPIRLQVKPHVPGTCEFAKSVSSDRRNLHSSTVEALGPAIRHPIN